MLIFAIPRPQVRDLQAASDEALRREGYLAERRGSADRAAECAAERRRRGWTSSRSAKQPGAPA